MHANLTWSASPLSQKQGGELYDIFPALGQQLYCCWLKLICINCNNSLYKYYDKLLTTWHSISVHHAQFLHMSSCSQARSTRWLSSRCPAGPLRVCAPLLLPLWQSLSKCWWYRGGLETNPLWSTAGGPAGWSLLVPCVFIVNSSGHCSNTMSNIRTSPKWSPKSMCLKHSLVPRPLPDFISQPR